MGNWDMQLQYLREVYKKLDRLGENMGKETWLVKSNIDRKLYIWKEIDMEMTGVYQRLRMISSRNLASILDLIRIDDRIIIIEEYISGDTLEELVQSKRINERMAQMVVRQLLEVLSVLHRQNIVHRDINPGNVLVSTDSVVKLLDFGIARMPKEGQGRDTTILGTAGYSAPEQFGFQQTDARSDIYSLGVLFHVMLTGRQPQGNVCCHPAYQKFIQKCIALEPNQRYQNVLEAYRGLEGCKEEGEKTGSHNPGNYAAGNNPGDCIVDSGLGNTAKGTIPENVGNYGQEAAVGMAKPKVNPFVPVGFRSKVLWKQFLAGSFYVVMAIYMVEMVRECAVTPQSFFLELTALMLYAVLAFVCLTNYGDWVHRMWLLSKISAKWEMLIRFLLFCLTFYSGYELETYVRIVLLGLKE